ncbi:hypothetical protein NL108_017545, partial [Boleophthalmus pectinirostris]
LLEQLGPLLRDSDSGVRTRTCDLLHLVSAHAIGRRALLSSSLLGPLSLLLDDPDPDCRVSVHRVLNRLCLLPLADFLIILRLYFDYDFILVKLLLYSSKFTTLFSHLTVSGGGHLTHWFVSQEEELVLLLSTLARCIRLDALPALASGAVELLRHKLTHGSAHVRREAAAALLALSVPVEGKQQICALDLLSDLLPLLHDPDVEVRTNAAGVCMNTLIITA